MSASDVGYTHGHHESVLRSHSWRTAANSAAYLLPHLRPGMSLLDVGCGPGTITVELAQRLAPGRVVGVDTSSDVVDQARQHARARLRATPASVGDGGDDGYDASELAAQGAPTATGRSHSHAPTVATGWTSGDAATPTTRGTSGRTVTTDTRQMSGRARPTPAGVTTDGEVVHGRASTTDARQMTGRAGATHPHETPGQDVSPDVSFVVADLWELDPGEGGVAEDGFDVVHAHQVLQHLPDPVGALRTMARLTRPGGLVAARDADYDAMKWSPADERLDRWLALIRELTRRNGGEPDAGRYLFGWAHAAGLEDAVYSTSTWTFATPDDRAWWGDLWAERTMASRLAEQARSSGLATEADLADMADAWRSWAAHPDATFTAVHGELLARS